MARSPGRERMLFSMELTSLAAWPITPRSARSVASGLNNDSYFVSSDEGEYVLRVYRNTADHSRVRDEHDLLGRLAMQGLPFAVPTPVATRDGDTIAVLETDDGPRLATLFHRIAGEPLTQTHANARLAGRALAVLDRALANIDRPVRPPVELRDMHALVPDPIAALDDLDLGADRERIALLFERVAASHDALVNSLPLQFTHGDFSYGNMLAVDGTVTGFLDFEFAGPDVRAGDLACAIYINIVRASDDERWRDIEAFVGAYRRALPLDPAEAAAIPDLLLRRSAYGIVHWIGRWYRGLTSRESILERVERNALLTRWLADNDARLALTVLGQSKLPAR